MKGAIGLQFNWIFVLIIGALIFGVFILQTETSGKQAKFEASLTIRETMQGLLAAPSDNSYQKIEVPQVTILNECDEEESTLFLGDTRLPIPTTYYALHAPKKMNSKTFHLQVKDRVTMLTSESNIFVFVDRGTPQISEFYDAFRGRKISTDANGESNYPPRDTKLSYTIIYYLPDFDVTEVDISAGANFPLSKRFNVAFITPRAEGGGWVHLTTNQAIEQSPFVSTVMPYSTIGEALGLIVDGDGELSQCLRKQELRKLETQLELFALRTGYLKTQSSLERCNVLLSTGEAWLRDLLLNLDVEESNVFFNVKDSLNQLDRLNEDLLRNNCPVIR